MPVDWSAKAAQVEKKGGIWICMAQSKCANSKIGSSIRNDAPENNGNIQPKKHPVGVCFERKTGVGADIAGAAFAVGGFSGTAGTKGRHLCVNVFLFLFPGCCASFSSKRSSSRD